MEAKERKKIIKTVQPSTDLKLENSTDEQLRWIDFGWRCAKGGSKGVDW